MVAEFEIRTHPKTSFMCDSHFILGNGPENIPGTSLHVDEMGACVRNSLLNGGGVLIVAQC